MRQDLKNPKKWLFFLWNIEPKDMNMMYECEFTVNGKDDLHNTKSGNPTTLLQGMFNSFCRFVLPIEISTDEKQNSKYTYL